ncbi:MAG: K+/H+ antiporter subunit F [Paracoccaceae bacterium]
MFSLALTFAITCFALALAMNLWRIAFAPTVADRILAVDTMTVNAIALLMLYGVRVGDIAVFEPAMLFAMTGFVSTVAYCKYLLRGSIIE